MTSGSSRSANDSAGWEDPWAGGAAWVAAQFALLVAIVVAGLWVDGWPFDEGPAWTVAGALAAAGGLALFVGGIAAHGAAITPLPRPREPLRLVESGAYRLVRHPIYGGLILLAAGFAFWRASLMAFLLSAALALLFHGKSRVEERWLERLAPDYVAYRGRVRRRFIPFVY